MDTNGFWTLIEDARSGLPDLADGNALAHRASSLLAARPRAEIIAGQQALWDLMAASYRSPPWAAAYVINGGCSDDGFDYFRGRLILQGRDTFERVLADPDALAELPAIGAAAADGADIDGEEALSIVRNAHETATGEELPADVFTIRYPNLDPDWNFDFDDQAEMRHRLPRLTALYEY
ncbi:DUF4240 domain-containing protein [Embleya sp. NPDC020886]|uniref:DUF4240 domain-containing protein n=1 Tax=Embleya sp. NPDC020886 TaxID=3363980 RepID=UPI0037A06F8D